MSILNTSVSGMLADSNWLSSISQNVANANTTGYKNVETDFSSLVDQICNGDPDFGGVATSQVSLNSLQGNVVSTSTTTDLAVQGSGFFVVSNSSGELFLTRNGSFAPDASGNLVNSAGYYLMGENVQSGASPLAANSLSGLCEGQCQRRRPDRDGDDGRLAHRQSALDGDAGRRRRSAVGQYRELDLYRSDVARRLRQSRRRAHDQSLFHQHRRQTPGRSTPSTRRMRRPAAAFPIPPARSRPRPDLQSDDRRALLRLAAFDCGAERADDVPRSQQHDAARRGLQRDRRDRERQRSERHQRRLHRGQRSLVLQLCQWDVDHRLRHSAGQCGEPGQSDVRQRRRLPANRASGPVYLGTAGGAGFGSIESSSLESSTVDLATELTDMIQAQSAYEANSKVFQTGRRHSRRPERAEAVRPNEPRNPR